MTICYCPTCEKDQKKYFKTWKYGEIEVFRYKCDCGNIFNFYMGKKTTWSIPNSAKNKKRT